MEFIEQYHQLLGVESQKIRKVGINAQIPNNAHLHTKLFPKRKHTVIICFSNYSSKTHRNFLSESQRI